MRFSGNGPSVPKLLVGCLVNPIASDCIPLLRGNCQSVYCSNAPTSATITVWERFPRLYHSSLYSSNERPAEVSRKIKSGEGVEFVGPIVLGFTEGKGRGFKAARFISAGELLLADIPLAIVTGPIEHEPPSSGVVHLLRDALKSGAYLPWLRALSDGRETSAPDTSNRATPPLNEPLPPPFTARIEELEGALEDDDMETILPMASSLGSEHIHAAGIVATNAFGDDYEDLALARLRGAEPRSHVGLWPRFSILNHSCLPNALHYVAGNVMVVRAASEIASGQEVCVSYLGRDFFAPVGVRQQRLRDAYSFECRCPRCRAEGQLDAGTLKVLSDVWSSARLRLLPAFTAAASTQDLDRLAEAGSEIASLEQLLSAPLARLSEADGGYSGTDVPGPAVLAAASVYDLLELRYMHDEALGLPSATESLSVCCRIMEALDPGSELHMFQTAALLQAAIREHGKQSQETVDAAAACQAAHILRYGAQDSGDLLSLIRHNIQIAKEFL